MSGAIQTHRQVPLSDAKISKETKIQLYKMLWKYDIIISKGDINIGQTDHIQMHKATKPDAASIAAQTYPLALKNHDFLKQEIIKLLDAGISHKSMSHGQVQ